MTNPIDDDIGSIKIGPPLHCRGCGFSNCACGQHDFGPSRPIDRECAACPPGDCRPDLHSAMVIESEKP